MEPPVSKLLIYYNISLDSLTFREFLVKMNAKIVHYCWFGPSEKGKLIQDCMKTWQKYLPDYKFREWNDSDIKTFNNLYVDEAAKLGKWAFVSDYARLYALYNYGGVYLDTDVELRRNIDEFLVHDFFSCFEYRDGSADCYPISALMGAQKGNEIIYKLLQDYVGRRFVRDDGSLDQTPNTKTISALFEKEYAVRPPYSPEEKLMLSENEIIYPYHYFCTDSRGVAFAVHHFNGSWKKKHWVLLRNKAGSLFIAKNSYLRNLPEDQVYFRLKIFKNRNLIYVRNSKN